MAPCEKGQSGYGSLRADLIAKLDAYACTVDDDCTIVRLGDHCRPSCGTAVNVRSASALSEELATYDAVNCATCPPSDEGCPDYVPACVDQTCTYHL